jgi:hypothetical protein
VDQWIEHGAVRRDEGMTALVGERVNEFGGVNEWSGTEVTERGRV